MNDWLLTFDGYDPEREGVRETLCALGNGYLVSRGAALDSIAGDIHYPGTYLAGGYNRLTTEISGREIENEDLVNIPNWLPLLVAIDGGPWLRPETVTYLDYKQTLDMRGAVLSRSLRIADAENRILRIEEERFVSMDDRHLAAIALTVTPENWSGRLTIRSELDGGVINAGVPRYRALSSRHLETLDLGEANEETIWLRSRFSQARREVVMAARTRVTGVDGPLDAERWLDRDDDRVAQHVTVDAAEGMGIRAEKLVAIHTSIDRGISEPGLAALERVRDAEGYAPLLSAHRRAWEHMWRLFDIDINTIEDGGVEQKLHLHIFHLLQTASRHSIDLDVGIPPRGWNGEAYRGHVMWDELFIFPYLTLRLPVLIRALLRYRHRRLPAARRLAREAGYAGAMFPWMSGSDGREETQTLHLNPVSGRWVPDNSQRQRHVNLAIAYNIWAYYRATGDRAFLVDYGAELLIEMARFWSSIATEDAPGGRFAIRGVMGPDEFHTAYPGIAPEDEAGIDNNAYTNVMVAWSLTRTLDVLELLPATRREELTDRLGLEDAEIARWDEISRRLHVPFHADGIISQFEGYEDLKEFDWEAARAEHGDIQRLDRVLESHGESPNAYKVSKQADALMLFFLFSTEELVEVFERLGYPFVPDDIGRTVEYYMARTSHGSTLSWLTHAWVLARADRSRSWALFRKALDSDFADIQGGTTREGIHLGAMAGTVDMVHRCYTGIEPRVHALDFNPRLPDELLSVATTVRYRDQVLDVLATHEHLRIASRPMSAAPVTIAYRGRTREMSPGQSFEFRLVSAQPRPADRIGEQRDALCGPEPRGQAAD